ncbi:MAG: DNA/RNA nuclease SfsA [Clostridia bacterium]|jgi:sugar fermentation stimulation protein A|nr:DNA/RNA nuclease SfsA [Clostridia bacterium]
MKYKNIKEAKFIARPNRFIAHIEIEGKEEICHVKNTGRCKELLIPNTTVFVQEVESKNRKTKYDLITVKKGERLINIDSQVPNKVFHEWVRDSNYFKGIRIIKPEYKYKNSRFDFFMENESRKILVEVKGVTLEKEGVALFPDAPTERGIKHLNELVQSLQEGYEAYVVFIIQMKDILYFSPNYETHRAFAEALIRAEKQGVRIIALDCQVGTDFIQARNFVEVRLEETMED